MSVKINAIANYICQGYSILIGIIITPFYLQYLGAEAFGLVGFFILMQSWLYVLDMGLSPTLGRQIAFSRGQNAGFNDFIKLLRSFEIIYLILSFLLVCFIFSSSEWISLHWIIAFNIDVTSISYCVSLMGLIIGFRLFASLYRSGINGMEDQVWLSIVNIVLVSLKFIGALILLRYVTTEITHFFEYQLLVGFLEVIIIGIRFYNILPISTGGYGLKFDLSAIKNIAPFALGIAYTSGIWILITQSDKLILSALLPLSEFGYFSLIALIAGVITVLTGPIMQAILPRMTVLISDAKHEEMCSLYRKSTQVVAVITLSITFVVAIYSEQLIYAWTGDMLASKWGGEVLFWYALGNGILAITAFQYYLQNAFGQLKLHIIGATISAVIQLPLIYFSAVHFGAVGAGMAWFGFRFTWFLWWTPFIHDRFLPGLHFTWLSQDLFPILVVSASVVTIAYYFIPTEDILDQFQLFSLLILLGFITLLLTAFSSSAIREAVVQQKLRIDVP